VCVIYTVYTHITLSFKTVAVSLPLDNDRRLSIPVDVRRQTLQQDTHAPSSHSHTVLNIETGAFVSIYERASTIDN